MKEFSFEETETVSMTIARDKRVGTTIYDRAKPDLHFHHATEIRRNGRLPIE